LALTSPTGCGRSVGVVRLWTKTTEFSFLFLAGLYHGLRPFWNGLRHFSANLHLISTVIHADSNYFLMGVHLAYYFFLIGLCPGLVDNHPEDESTSMDHNLLIIGVQYISGHPLFVVVVYHDFQP
jgi:hypothetical protein